MEGVTIALLVVLSSVIIYLWMIIRKQMNYWIERGVSNVTFFENVIPTLRGKLPFNDGGKFLYDKYPNEKIVGCHMLMSPFLVVRDPEIIERILVKDFSHFVDRDKEQYDKDTLMNLGLFLVTGNDWRTLRNKITPTFTSGKMKMMFSDMTTCADHLVKRIGESKGDSSDMVDEFGSYAIDVSASTIFGIDIQNEKLKNEYKFYASRVFNISKLRFVQMLAAMQFPKLGKFLGFQLIKKEIEDYFRKLISATFKQRLDGKNYRNDYVQLLLKLKEKGHLESKLHENDSEDEDLSTEHVPHRIELTDDILSAQAFQFLIAGYEPLINTLNFLLYELSQNEEIQRKVRQEINKCIERNGELNYTAVKEMTYLEQCIKETLRKYPIIPNIQRRCVKDYALNDSLTIEKGVMIIIALRGLQSDPAYFPDPEKFDPDRFHPDSNINHFAYLPFGAGPRVCIGMRFAIVELKLAISKLIKRFSVTLSPKSSSPLELDSTKFFMVAKNSHFIFKDMKKLE